MGETTWAVAILKTTWYVVVATMFAYLDIKDTQMLILTIVMIIDFICGVCKQHTINRKEITSHKAWLWMFKKTTTLILVLSVALMFKWIWIDWSNYIEWMLGIFITAEVYSITRSIYAIRTWKIMPEYDVISLIIKRIWGMIIWMIDSFFDN